MTKVLAGVEGTSSTMAASEVVKQVELAEEDALRAHMYRLLARFLARPPGERELTLAADMGGDGSDLGMAIGAFARIAGKSPAETVAREYHDLFVGVGRGELLPYASYYLTGFLHEKPLARLRDDMARLGIARQETVKEPEDHIAALFEMMAGLIVGEFGTLASLEDQKQFFATHVGSWAKHFFKDLEGAKASVLYAALASVGRIFMDIEEMAFTMD
jgi:TorA maturation chaperone TorD